MKITKSLIPIILISFLVNLPSISKSQELNILELVKEIPDSLFKFNEHKIEGYIKQDINKELFQKKYYLGESTSFENEKDISLGFDRIENPRLMMKYPNCNFSGYYANVAINKNWINFNYYNEAYVQQFAYDLIFMQDRKSYSVIILRQYFEQFGLPPTREIYSYYFNEKENTFEENEIAFPVFDWSDFYSAGKNLNCLAGFSPLFQINLLSVDKELIARFVPDLEAVVVSFMGGGDRPMYQKDFRADYDMIYDSLGFSTLPKAKGIYYKIPSFEEVDRDKFEHIFLFNAFCDEVDQDWHLNLQFEHNESKWQVNSLDVENNLSFSGAVLSIQSEMMNNLDIKSLLYKDGDKDYFIISYNSSGFLSESKLKVFEVEGNQLNKEVSKEILPILTNSDLGITYPENVFEKFPDVFYLRYDIDHKSLRISLGVNPPFGNKEAEEAMNYIEDYDKLVEYSFKELFK